MVMDLLRHGPNRHRDTIDLSQHHELLIGHRNVQRRTAFFPVREQLVHGARFHHRTRENVSADFRALFKHDNRQFLTLFLRQLLQPDRC